MRIGIKAAKNDSAKQTATGNQSDPAPPYGSSYRRLCAPLRLQQSLGFELCRPAPSALPRYTHGTHEDQHAG
jgi:hypothetical protein